MTVPTLARRLETLRTGPAAALVALEWGPPSGVVVANWFSTLDADAPVARIQLLLVAPDARGRGIARLLVKAASRAARLAGCATIELDVPHRAADLLAFARNTGFAEAGHQLARSLRKEA